MFTRNAPFHVLALCRGICQLDIRSRTQSVRGGKAGAEREGGQLVSHMLHRGDPPPLSPKSCFCVQGGIVHPFTASVRWLGWVTPSGSPECGHTWQTVSKQGEGREGEGGAGAVGNSQALSKKCFYMHPASQQQSESACIGGIVPAKQPWIGHLLHHEPHTEQVISSKMLTCGESDLTAMSL